MSYWHWSWLRWPTPCHGRAIVWSKATTLTMSLSAQRHQTVKARSFLKTNKIAVQSVYSFLPSFRRFSKRWNFVAKRCGKAVLPHLFATKSYRWKPWLFPSFQRWDFVAKGVAKPLCHTLLTQNSIVGESLNVRWFSIKHGFLTVLQRKGFVPKGCGKTTLPHPFATKTYRWKWWKNRGFQR